MQSYAAVASSTSRRPVNAPSHTHKYNHGPTRASACPIFDVAEPVQSTPQRDFHLDTFFNPVWMTGPNVFSFAKDGTVVLPEVGRAASRSTHQSRVVPCSRRGFDKWWKNVAITEQDDAELATMLQAEAERKRAEAKAKLLGRVYKWPPKPAPAPCEKCAVLSCAWSTAGRGRGADGTYNRVDWGRGAESVVPALSWSSGESEPESEEYRAASSQVGPSVGRDGFQKAAAPVSLLGRAEGGKWTRCDVERRVGEVSDNRVLNPSIFMTEQWVEDQLTVRLKEVLRMPDT